MASKALKITGAIVGGAVLLVGGAFGGAAIASNNNQVTVNGLNTQIATLTAQHILDQASLAAAQASLSTASTNDKQQLSQIEQFIYDNGDNAGTMGALTNDLNSNQISQIADRVVFVNELQSMSTSELQTSDFKQFVSDNSNLGVSDIKDIRVNDKSDQIAVTSINFKHQSANTELTGTFKDTNDNKYNFDVVLNFDNNQFVDFDSITITPN
jgi:hypothetical protein